jgi:colanic acid biosynthesis glycosyl transferase WcaI
MGLSETSKPESQCMPARGKTFLIFSQTFVPDPAAVGQHIASVAVEMARRGHRVRVYTANRGYDDPSLKYPSRETFNGVDVRRLKFSSFGKKSILTRAVGTLSFMIQVFFLALFTPRVWGILFSTSPPMVGIGPSIAKLIRRIPIAFWAMDLNPDQLIAMGKISARSITARCLEAANRFILWNATLVVALDRFMADRLRARARLDDRIVVIPPWPHEDSFATVEPDKSPFRAQHGLAGKFVIMYSGNHSPSNPLRTLLDASLQLRDDPDIRFFFVGGGTGKKEIGAFIRDHNSTNVVSLPYQPLAELHHSLSAANAHIVSLGDAMVGIIHPCKIYGAMAVARPILFVGPEPSHVSDLLHEHPIGAHIAHGDVAGAVQAIRHLRALPQSALDEMGKTAQKVIRESYSHQQLCGRFCDHLERMLGGASVC